MEQNGTVEHLRGMWLRLKGLTSRPDRRSSIALATASAAVLLIVAGIAFAGQATQSTQAIDQAASLSHAATPDNPAAPAGDGTTKVTVNSNSANPGNVSMPSGQTLPTPSTIIGPHGEKIVVPPNPTTKASGPSSTPVTTPPTIPSSPLTSDPGATASTVPAGVSTTTTVRPPPSNGPATPTASAVVMNNSPEDPDVALKVTGADPDGFISSITVDWNDGTPPTVYAYPLSGCVDPPSSAHMELPAHTFVNSGNYTIAVTATSVSCTNEGAVTAFANAPVVITNGTSTPPVTTVGSISPNL